MRFNLGSDRNGNYALATVVALTPILLASGLALNVYRAESAKSVLQQSLDSAVLAAASSNDLKVEEKIARAKTFFLSNPSDECTNTFSNFKVVGPEVQGEAGCRVEDIFTSYFNPGFMDVAVRSTAVAEPSGNPMCIIALNPAAKKALLASGGSNIDANACNVQVNSASVEAVNFSGGSTLNSARNCFVGQVKQGLANMTPRPDAYCDPVDDPFASIAKPKVGACDEIAFNANTDTTLKPGVYCGGMRVSNATFTFEPGLYVIVDGTFESTGGATLQGDGVSFFLTGAKAEAGLVWSGGGSYHFTAMRTGPLAGFIVYLDPGALKDDRSHVSGGGDIFYEGAFYFPGQTLLISGGGTVTSPSPFTAYVADIIEYTGGGTLRIGADASKSSVPIPAGLYAAGAGPIRLTQ